MVALKTCRNGERIEFPWQPKLLVIASLRQKPSVKFDISILKYWDINIILAPQIAALVIGSQSRAEPRCPCGLAEAASLQRELRCCGDVKINLCVEMMTHSCRISSWKHVSGLHIAPQRHLTPHVDTHLGRNILSSFVRMLVQFLTFLNNSAPARIARSYSVLNMPKRATDKGQEARLQLALLLHTIGRQIHFATMHAALWDINFVPGPFLSSPITTSQVFLFR